MNPLIGFEKYISKKNLKKKEVKAIKKIA